MIKKFISRLLGKSAPAATPEAAVVAAAPVIPLGHRVEVPASQHGIDPSLVDPNDIGMLEDTLVAAVNEAILKSQEHSAQKLEAVTGGISLPGMF